MAIFKKESNEEKAINELVNKKEMLTTGVKKEITSIENQIVSIKTEIGKVIFDKYSVDKNFDVDSSIYKEKLTDIDELLTNIDEKKEKLKDICDRYDEEIQILKESLGLVETLCPGCNSPYNPNVDKFCMSCGARL